VGGNAPNPTTLNNIIFLGSGQAGINYDFAVTLINFGG
jgi:hypothetical protein